MGDDPEHIFTKNGPKRRTHGCRLADCPGAEPPQGSNSLGVYTKKEAAAPGAVRVRTHGGDEARGPSLRAVVGARRSVYLRNNLLDETESRIVLATCVVQARKLVAVHVLGVIRAIAFWAAL